MLKHKVSLESSYVSSQTVVNLEIFRQNSGPVWQPNQCFELYVGSPYLDPTVYRTFQTENPPVCSAVSEGFNVNCSIKNGYSNILALVFTSITSTASTAQSIRIKFNNFNTPFSAQLIRTINMRSYSDSACTSGMKTVSVPGLTIQQVNLPINSVSLSSTTDILGNITAQNALIVKFTPQTTMAPGGQGSIDIGIPNWYAIGNTGELMYSPTATNKCTSNCMKVTFSGLVGQAINIIYEQMQPTCLKGTAITIQCSQFFNPITPELWPGFSLTIYDNEIEKRIIEQTIDTLSFDATKFKPIIMPISSFIVDPANTMISTYSTWTLSLQVNIPLQTECYIKIYLPPDFGYARDNMQASGIFIKPNLDKNLYDEDLNIIFRTADGKIPKSSVLFKGCNYEPALGKTPFGRLDISSISTQNAIKDSQTFQIEIYKDFNMTKLIAKLADGVIVPASSIKPGILSDISIVPADFRVQRLTQITITFTISHQLNSEASCVIRLPSGLTTPSAGSNLTVSSPNGSTTATNATVLPGNILQIQNIVEQGKNLLSGLTISLTIFGIKNQNSVRDAGNYQITTQNKIDGQYYNVDQQTIDKSFTATTGTVTAVGTLKINNPTNYAKSNIYSMTFKLEDVLPKAGYVLITVPSDVLLSPSTTQSSGSCKIYTCTFADSKSVKFLMQAGLPLGTEITLDVGGVINPRSFQPSGQFVVTTLDTDSESQIDSGYLQTATMSIAGTISSFSAQQSSFVNGQVNTYTISVQALIPVFAGDQLSFTLPAELEAPTDELTMNCTGKFNVKNLTCSVQGQKILVTFISFNTSSGTFTWTVSGIRNPTSTKTSSGFSNISFMDSKSYTISSLVGSVSEVTNKFPAQLVVYNITQESLKPNQVTNYQISFTPINALPAVGSIQITYPQQITLIDGSKTVCIVTIVDQTYQQKCLIDDSSRTITIKGIFASSKSYSGQITISLQKVQNAVNNKPGNGFVIQTYADENQTYIVDKLNDFILLPLFECEYPCMTCSSTNRQSCLNCWPNFDDPKYLMFYPNGTSSCRSFCDPGFTTNGNTDMHCQECDPSCGTCAETGQIGDAQKCIDCSPAYSFRLSMTQTCLKSCNLGMYNSTNTSCSMCRQPCEGCSGSESSCTSCFKNGKVPNLFLNQCIGDCPAGYVSVDNICVKCKSPCSTCFGKPDSCVSCDGTGGTKFTYQKKCFADCPAGSAPNTESLTCFGCLQGCDLCDINNQTKCLKCTKPTLAYQGDCITSCPDGWHVNSDETACRPWQLGDLGTLPYPFLIAGGIFSIICLFGMLRRRAYLSHGKMRTESPQHTLTCIIIVLAPLQFMATIVQWILSYVYGTTTFCILAALVTLAAIIVNVAFQIMFAKHFDSKKIPTEIDRKVRLGKMDKADAIKYLEARDEKFNQYKRQNRCTTYTIFTLTAAINFKFNKMFYSFFYDLKVFQAHFSQAKYYRKMITWYQIIYLICIDLALICIDITGLTQIEQGNQLFITMIETLVLSILSILLGSIELWLLKSTLRYTEPFKDKSALKLKQGIETESEDEKNLDKKYDKTKMAERRRMMDGLLRQVRHNKQLFLNNKLDELIHSFGDRKCKSMMDLATGWPLEDDPQERVTYPISPIMRFEYAEMGVTFHVEDAYSNQANNVYAESKTKFVGMEEGTQNDAGFLEFKDALNRRQGGLMSQTLENDLEERRLRRVNRRRGRKNKYHAQIDQEDDQDLDHVEASDNEGDLQIIKEQEFEEEEQIRKIVQSESKLHQDIAQIRKKQLADENLAKQQKDLADAEARKKKAIELEKAQQASNAQKQLNTMKLLQQEASAEQAKRDIEEKKRAQELSRQNKKIKEDLEKQEAIKQLALKKEAAKIKAEEDAKNKKAQDNEKQKLKKINAHEIESKKNLIGQQINSVIPAPNRNFESRSEMNQSVYVADNGLQDFKNLGQQIDAPPKAELRTFNENDILGDLDRNENGNVVVLQDTAGTYFDKKGQKTNQRGYLIDGNSGSIIENQNLTWMFTPHDVDERGEVPAPFSLEKYNFNPHQIMGDFDYIDGKPEVMQTNKGSFMDKKGNRVNRHGWMTQTNQGHLIDLNGRKKFDKRQLQNDGDLYKLFNYQGKRFDVKEVMGVFEKNQNGKILPQTSNQGLIDLLGRRCNEKGYLTDAFGNIIDVNGRQLWKYSDLKNGEFHKIFPFTKFNIRKVQGQIDINPSGQPILKQDPSGQFIDHQKRLVNRRGYLIDSLGNVIDDRGFKMFDKVVLDQDGEIPQVFRTGLLKSDTGSSLSRLMSEIEKNHPSDVEEQNQLEGQDEDRGIRQEGETSLDSQMEDTPANYNQANQRFERDPYQAGYSIPEEENVQSEYGSQQFQKQSKKPAKQKLTTVVVLQPTGREKSMAGAYGGQAVGSIRRPGVKYDKERLKDSKKFRVNTADEPQVRAELTKLVKSGSKIDAYDPSFGSTSKKGSVTGQEIPQAKLQSLMAGVDSHSQGSQIRRGSRADSRTAYDMKKKQKSKKAGMKDGEFEELFGKEIDQFLENSEWDMRSLDKVSQESGTDVGRIKQLEQEFLKAQTVNTGARNNNQSNQKSPRGQQVNGSPRPKPSPKQKLGPDRETIINFSDDPGVIHRGEILPFETKKKFNK